MPKTVFLGISHGWHARLLLRSSFLKTLKAVDDLRIVIISPNAEEDYFRETFGGTGFLRPALSQGGKLWSRMDTLRRKLLLNSRPSHSYGLITEGLRHHNPRSYWALRLLNSTFKFAPFTCDIFRQLDRAIFPDRCFDKIFAEFNPDALVICSTVHNPAFFMLRRAKANRVKTVYILESWDNPTTKMSFLEYPDKYMVWNEIMKGELQEFHDIPPWDIWVTGSAYHDVYAHPEEFCDRRELASRSGMDPDAKWIVVAATLRNLYPPFDEFLDRLERHRSDGRFGPRCQILVRPHPQAIAGYSQGHGIVELEAIRSKYPNIFYDVPRVLSQILPVDVASQDILRLAELVFHADVVISFLSTVTIDACAADTPVILPAFDDYADQTWFPTLRKRLSFNHHRNVIRTGGVRVAEDFETLVSSIAQYMHDPALDREGRQRITQEQCFKLDGNAGVRMAEHVLDYIYGPSREPVDPQVVKV